MKTFKQFILESEHPMIDVDGVMRHRNNSEGEPIHSTDEGIRNFHRWFGKSKIVDEFGRPKVVHHTTKEKWDTFDINKAGNSSLGKALYVSTDNPVYTEKPWIGKKEEQQHMKLYVKSESPLDLTRPPTDEETKEHNEKFSNYLQRPHDAKEDAIPLYSLEKRGGSIVNGASEAGFDSVTHEGTRETGKHIAIPKGHQIKSTETNNGNFNPDSNNINE